MAKRQQELENPMVGTVIPFRQPRYEEVYIRCGCGGPAAYEVYENKQPHCQLCYEEAISTDQQVLVRRLEGGYDDAS